jgi:hypothetical protein
MPGPNEPNGQQMNHVFEPSTKEIELLKNGTCDISLNDIPLILKQGF